VFREFDFTVESDGAWIPTRDKALAVWERFLPRAREYARLRNRVEPGHPHVTRLSAAIRARLVSEEELVASLLARHPFESVEKLAQEMLWRQYWKGWLEMRPSVWTRYRASVQSYRTTGDARMLEWAEAVAAGRSGVAIMDRFARELISTGYLHNHARMWWASFWVHVERLPWELGADHFMRHLLDADPASNTLGWRWVAGIQTPGKTYLVRRSNLERHVAASWMDDLTGMERLEDAVVTAATIPEEDPLPRPVLQELPVKPPVKDKLRWGLWIHGEDLSAETSVFKRWKPAALWMHVADDLLAAHGLSPLRRRFLREVLTDGGMRAARHFGVPVSGPDAGQRTMAEAIAAWARLHQLDGVVAMAPSVGPLAEAIPSIRTALESDRRRLWLCRRPEDAQRWPMATSGYFPFWQRTVSQLRALADSAPGHADPG